MWTEIWAQEKKESNISDTIHETVRAVETGHWAKIYNSKNQLLKVTQDNSKIKFW